MNRVRNAILFFTGSLLFGYDLILGARDPAFLTLTLAIAALPFFFAYVDRIPAEVEVGSTDPLDDDATRWALEHEVMPDFVLPGDPFHGEACPVCDPSYPDPQIYITTKQGTHALKYDNQMIQRAYSNLMRSQARTAGYYTAEEERQREITQKEEETRALLLKYGGGQYKVAKTTAPKISTEKRRY